MGVIASAIIAVAAALLVPLDSVAGQAFVGAGALVVSFAALCLMVFGVFLMIAPYRQRNAARAEASRLFDVTQHRLGDDLRALNAFAAEGRKLEDEIRAMNMAFIFGTDGRATEWANRVDVYLENNLPELKPLFWSDALGRELGQPGASYAVSNWANYVERRRRQIDEFIKEVTKRQDWYQDSAIKA